MKGYLENHTTGLLLLQSNQALQRFLFTAVLLTKTVLCTFPAYTSSHTTKTCPPHNNRERTALISRHKKFHGFVGENRQATKWIGWIWRPGSKHISSHLLCVWILHWVCTCNRVYIVRLAPWTESLLSNHTVMRSDITCLWSNYSTNRPHFDLLSLLYHSTHNSQTRMKQTSLCVCFYRQIEVVNEGVW